MENFHDNEIIKYEVNLKEQIIIIYTQTRRESNVLNFKIVFSEVFVHYFENELVGSTILEFEKRDLSNFIKDNTKLLNQRKDFLWPMDYDTFEELEETLKNQKYSYYSIMSSYGLSGWILSKDIQID